MKTDTFMPMNQSSMEALALYNEKGIRFTGKCIYLENILLFNYTLSEPTYLTKQQLIVIFRMEKRQ